MMMIMIMMMIMMMMMMMMIRLFIIFVQGFAGATPQEKAKVDMLIDSTEDLIKPYIRISTHIKDEKEKVTA